MPAPILTEENMKMMLEGLRTPEATKVRSEDTQRFLMYNGAIKSIVEETIKSEFKKPETIEELIARIIPLNIPQKIINKLANVYNESPVRIADDRNEMDQELLDLYVKKMELNIRQKEANRYFKLFKSNLQEMVVTEKGYPTVRNLPRHSYALWSHSPVCPDVPDTFVKFLNFEREIDKQRFVWWTDKQHLVTDGAGEIQRDIMNNMGNPDGINPFGIAPFVYANSSTFSVDPVPDDDLLRMSIVIPLLLSDLAFAVKYLSWAVVYVIGESENDVPFSPNSLITLPFGPNGEKPEINTVSPAVDIDGVLRFVEFLVATLLSTKNLSSSAIQGQLSAVNPASGVAKALDSAESQEDKKDQQSFFNKAEKELWEKLSKNMIPVWRRQNLLAPEINREFSSEFDVSVIFREPQVIVSENESIDIANKKVDGGWSTHKRELQRMNPELDEQAIEELMFEIQEEKQKRLAFEVSKMEAERDINEGEDIEVETESHTHQGMGPAETLADSEEIHNHPILDEPGSFSSSEKGGAGHTHKFPNGEDSSTPR